ncbi:hypothetical protein L0Y65_06055 [Candidatus Micrarchaeota archaeon]|nr:hypothetical protein [Candidatus Micrarchaeota archaeon]
MAGKGFVHLIICLFALQAASGAVFAASGGSLTDTEKQCIKGCCEAVGGTYEWEHNGCESPQADMFECADACREEKGNSCPLAALMMFGLAGAAIFCTSNARQ